MWMSNDYDGLPLLSWTHSQRLLSFSFWRAWVRRGQIPGQEAPDLGAGVTGGRGVEAVEQVAARGVGVYPVLEDLLRRMQRVDQPLDLAGRHVLVIGVGVDEQRRAELVRVPRRRAAAVFVRGLSDSFAKVIRRGEELLVILASPADSFFEVAHRHAGIAGLVVVGVPEDGEQGNEPAVAPANDADSPWINFVVALQHPLARGVHVLDLQSPVIDLPPKVAAVTAAAAVIGRNHRVALLHQLAHDMRVLIGGYVAVNLAVGQHDERDLPRRFALPGQEREGGHDDLVAPWGWQWVVGGARRRSGETDLIHQRHVPQPLVPEKFVHLAREPGVEVAEAFLERLQPRGSVVGLRTAGGGEEEQGEDKEAVHPTAQAASRPSRPLW